MGRAAALNTLGNIAGALLGGFVLLPLVGSLRSVHVLAGVVVALAVVPAVLAIRRAVLGVAIPAAALAFLVAARLGRSTSRRSPPVPTSTSSARTTARPWTTRRAWTAAHDGHEAHGGPHRR